MSIKIKGEKSIIGLVHPYAEYEEIIYHDEPKRYANSHYDERPENPIDYYKLVFRNRFDEIKNIILSDNYDDYIGMLNNLLRIDEFQDWLSNVSHCEGRVKAEDQTTYIFIDDCLERIRFNMLNGKVIETSCGIEDALNKTDIGSESPCSTLVLPFEAIYLKFGEGQYGIKIAKDTSIVHVANNATEYIDGVYLREYVSKKTNRRRLQLTTTLRAPESNKNFTQQYVSFGLEINDEDESIDNAFERFLSEVTIPGHEINAKNIGVELRGLLEHVIKILLYLNSSQVRQDVYCERDDLIKKISGLSDKNKKKYIKRLFKTYNKIIIGSDINSGASDSNVSKISKGIHWRRGHFRNQKHGENRALTKTIWIKPVLINKDYMVDEVESKQYLVK